MTHCHLRICSCLVAASLVFEATIVRGAETSEAGTDTAVTVGKPASLDVRPKEVRLVGRRANHQLLVTGRYEDGTERDLTRFCNFHPGNTDLLTVSEHGAVSSRADGKTQIRVVVAGLSVTVPVSIEKSDDSKPISFRTEVVPVLSAAGCADIRCHGAPSGKSGFRLSLWGHNPALDLEQLTRNASGRRTNSLDPDNSLVLRKALSRMPHVGGRRFKEGSRFAQLLHRWQVEGLQDDPDSAELRSLHVSPDRRVLHAPARQQQLVVEATFEDGRRIDVTSLTTFSSTDLAIAGVDRTGLVEFHAQGEVAVLCRFGGRMESVRLMHIAAPAPDYRFPKTPESNYVDTHVFNKLRMLNISPSELCSDEVFVRRVFLDVCGILPTVDEATAFVESKEPTKRERLIDELLKRPEYADYWTKKWMDVLRVSRDSINLAGAKVYQQWLRERVEKDAPFDQIVHELITSQGESYKAPAANFYCTPRTPETITDPLFLQKDLAEATAQLFLGIRLQCAQCHNHPYERWTQNDYLSLASFFTQIKRTRLGKAGPKGRPERRQISISLDFAAKELTDPLREAPVQPGFPGEPSVKFDPKKDRRTLLAEWLTKKDNPFFAKAFVNRIWFHLHGRGIVEPVDDFRDSNPPSNGPLLNALAEKFVEGGYRMRPVIRTILNSRTYQLSSQPNDSNRNDTRYFSHVTPRPLPAEVLLDAISSVTGIPEQFEIMNDYTIGVPEGSVKFPLGTRAVQLPVTDVVTLINTEGKYVRYELHPFMRVFGQPSGTETCECAREPNFGRKQALELFVGEMLSARIARPENSLSRLLKSPASDAQRLAALYLVALSRTPSEAAAAGFLKHVADSRDKRKAWEDVLWTVLNSQEFIYQH